MTYGELFKSDKEGLDLLSANKPFEVTKFKTITIAGMFVGKPWVIAQVEYNDFRLWWAIAKANNIRTPMILRDSFRVTNNKYTDNIITDFYLNRQIIIPAISDVLDYINQIKG